MNSTRCIALLLLTIICTGCNHPASQLATVPMKIGSKSFNIEIARTADEQEKGLMQRDTLAPDHGMIFVFPEEKVVGFWMKNTRFPLDILFLDSSGKVVSIHQMQAYDLRTTSSDFPTRYAIELNLDAAGDAGVKTGDHIDIPPQAASK